VVTNYFHDTVFVYTLWHDMCEMDVQCLVQFWGQVCAHFYRAYRARAQLQGATIVDHQSLRQWDITHMLVVDVAA
jgi:hypothetical protein